MGLITTIQYVTCLGVIKSNCVLHDILDNLENKRVFIVGEFYNPVTVCNGSEQERDNEKLENNDHPYR